MAERAEAFMSAPGPIVDAMADSSGSVGPTVGAMLAQLTDAQRAVVDFDGTVLTVVGIAGSGKSVALVERAAALVAGGVAPEEIVVLSPSREAARLLRDALADRIVAPRSGPWARTPQSFAFEVLSAFARQRGQSAPRLMTGGEQEQIIGDLLAGSAAGDGVQWPSSISPEIRGLRGFRNELRDVIDRCSDYGVSPADLAASGREDWRAIAGFVWQYQAVVTAFDPVPLTAPELVARAAAQLNEVGRSGWPSALTRIRHVLIDDAQELTESIVALVGALARTGAVVVSAGDPDTATMEFRGGRPEFAATLGEALGLPSDTLTLPSSFRLSGQIAAVAARVTASIGAARSGTQRRAFGVAAGEVATNGAVATVGLYSSASHNAAGIAARLRRRHIIAGVPWHDMAVVVRSAGAVDALVRALDAYGVPVRASRRPELFRENVATEPLVLAGALACGVIPATASTYTSLLGSYVGGMDALALRRLRRALRREELSGGGNRSADELIVEAFSVTEGFASIDQPAARAATAFHARLQDASRLAASGSAEQVVWSLWDTTRVPDGDGQFRRVDEYWRERTLAGGSDAAGFSRNLDAVVALCATASRYTEQHPDAPASEFFAEQLAREVADDIIVPSIEVDTVWIGLPAQMLARDFDTVVVSGVQDGVWPDLRLRDTLLGAGLIATKGAQLDAVDRRREVLSSELRLFARAITRARSLLYVTAIESEDEKPSALISTVDPTLRGGGQEPEEVETHPFTLRGMVGKMRRDLATEIDRRPVDDCAESDGATGRIAADEAVRAAVSGLAALAAEGVPGAHPRDWHGLAAISTEEPVWQIEPGNPVRLSPSGIESFETCPLGWFLDKYGANDTGVSAAIGTVVHGALEASGDEVSREALGAYVDGRWGELVFDAPWDSVRQRHQVDGMLDKLSAYLLRGHSAGNRRLAAEIRFADAGDTYVMHGSIDRIEKGPDGRLILVDLKTGRHLPSDKEMGENAQLASYQIAILDGLPQSSGADESTVGLGVAPGTRVAEAKLLGIGTAAAKFVERNQAPYTDQQIAEFRQRLTTVAAGMAGSVFVAHVEQHCLGGNHSQCAIHLVPAVTE